MPNTSAPAAEQSPSSEQENVSTWTFVGHWHSNELVIESVLPGVVEDTRPETCYWDEGLWAAAGTASSREAAMDDLVVEYEAHGWRWAREDEYTPEA